MASLSNINGIFDVHSTGAIQFNGNHGTAGQILKSNGNAAPTWIPQSDIVGAYLPLAGGTLTGATATASGISFTVGGTLSGSTANFSGFTTSATGFGINYVSGATVPMVILANATSYGIFYREATPDYIEFKHGGNVMQSFDGSGNVTIGGDFTVSGGDITLGGTGRIQGVDTVTDSTDAANKAYVDAHPGSGGTVTSVATGNGLTGGTITSTGTLTMSGDYTGNFSITGANLAGNSYSDPDIVLSITDEDTTASIRNKMTGSSAITKVSDATAPAPGCFQVNGSYYPQGFGPYYKISEGDEFIFEFWIRYVSGAATYNLLYAGSNFYNAAGTYLGNSQRYWGESGFNINANTPGWYHVSGTLGPSRGSSNGNIPTAAESMRLLFLFNYNPNGSIVTNYCGLKVYKSNPTVTKLYRKTLGSEGGTNRNRDLVIDSDGDIFGKDITATNIVTATGGNSTQWNLAYANRVTSLVAGTGISLTNASGPAVTVTATTQFSGPTFTSRNNTNGIAVDSATSNMSGYIHTSSAAGYSDGGLFVAAYSSSWVSQIFSNFRTGEIAVRGKNNGTWQAWRTVWDSVNLPNPVQSSGVTSVATGSGLTGGTITTTGTLSVDSTVIRTSGTQSITGNTTFYPSSTSTGYSTAAIELMASSSGTSGTPPRIAWHWGGVVASSITIEANGTIAVRNNPGNAYEQFKASIITATSNFSGNLTGNVTGNTSGSSGSCTGNSATATISNAVANTGYGGGTSFTFYQSSGSFSGYSGWHNYYIGNHGNGSNYYNTIIAIPFWGSPRYSRLEGNVQRGPFEFWTSERTIVSTHDVTAPRYYDTNTTYYGDFASTSNINALTLVGTLSGQNGYFNQDLAVGFNSGNIGGKLNIQINTANSIGIKNNLNGKSGAQGLLQYTSASYASGGYNMIFQAAPPSGSDTNMLLCYLNGNIVNRFNSYGQYSDRKLKENIVDTTPKLEDVKKIRIRNFNFKDDPYKQIGVIAQEFEEVFPGLVEDKEVPDQDETTKTVKYSVLVPILVKAIQELEARVKELENK